MNTDTTDTTPDPYAKSRAEMLKTIDTLMQHPACAAYVSLMERVVAATEQNAATFRLLADIAAKMAPTEEDRAADAILRDDAIQKAKDQAKVRDIVEAILPQIVEAAQGFIKARLDDTPGDADGDPDGNIDDTLSPDAIQPPDPDMTLFNARYTNAANFCKFIGGGPIYPNDAECWPRLKDLNWNDGNASGNNAPTVPAGIRLTGPSGAVYHTANKPDGLAGIVRVKGGSPFPETLYTFLSLDNIKEHLSFGGAA